MAYKLKDANGRFIEMNGMHKGTINKNYKYHGMSAWNDSTYSTSTRPFYSTYRRLYINGNYYTVSSTSSSSPTYIDAAYEATSVAIVGRYYSSSYKAYEVYVDGTLVASGDYTSSATTIYTLTKEANTCITIEGTYVNSIMTYNITTSATIWKTASYAWDNGVVKTYNVPEASVATQSWYYAGTTSADTTNIIPKRITIPSITDIYQKLGINEDEVISTSNVSIKLTFSKSSSNPDYAYNEWLRTSYNTTTLTPSYLPGSSVASVTQVSSGSPKTVTLSGSTHLGNTYYLYARQYNTTGNYDGNNYLCSVTAVVTFTVKYRSITKTRSYQGTLTRTNYYTMPALNLSTIKSDILTSLGIPTNYAGTLTIYREYLSTTVKNVSSSTYYYKITDANSLEVKSPTSISSSGTSSASYNYYNEYDASANTIIPKWELKKSTTVDGTYTTGTSSTVYFDSSATYYIYYRYEP